MKHSTIKIFTLLIFILWFGNIAQAGNKPDSTNSVYTLPVDSPKKEKAPPPPPPNMQTYPVVTNSAKLTLTAYTQVRFQYYQPDKDTTGKDLSKPSSFDIRNARLILRGTPLPHFGYNFQADFGGTPSGNQPYGVRVLDASGSYTFNPFAKLTVGQQKVPISYECLRTDYDIHSMSRSQVTEALGGRSKDVTSTDGTVNNNSRDIGLLFSGGIPNKNETNLNWVDYSLGLFQGQGINRVDADRNKCIAGRAVVHPIKNLQVGGSFFNGKATWTNTKAPFPSDTPAVRNRFGFDAAYDDGNRFYAVFEYLAGTDDTFKRAGYYGMLEGYIIPKKFAALVKYDTYDPNTNKDKDAVTITSFALNCYFTQYTKIQVQYDLVHENDAETQKKNDLWSIQAQILF